MVNGYAGESGPTSCSVFCSGVCRGLIHLEFCEQLQYDLKNELVLFPKNFKRAHDQANTLIKQHRMEQYNPQILSMREELKRRYQFKSDGLIVLPPRSAREIVVEGQKLRHCVGSYAQRMAEKSCIILFIRREAQQKKPFFTVAVQGDKIRQVRGSSGRCRVIIKWQGALHIRRTLSMQRKDLSAMTMTIPQRNSLVQEYLWCIDSVINQNYSLATRYMTGSLTS